MTVLVNISLLLFVTLNETFEHPLDVRLNLLQIIGMRQLLKIGSAQLLFRIPNELAECFVWLQPASVSGNNGHTNCCIIESTGTTTVQLWCCGECKRNRTPFELRSGSEWSAVCLLQLIPFGFTSLFHSLLFVHRLIRLFQKFFKT